MWEEGTLFELFGKEGEVERASTGQERHFSVAGEKFWIAQCVDTPGIDGPDSLSGCDILLKFYFLIIILLFKKKRMKDRLARPLNLTIESDPFFFLINRFINLLFTYCVCGRRSCPCCAHRTALAVCLSSEPSPFCLRKDLSLGWSFTTL